LLTKLLLTLAVIIMAILLLAKRKPGVVQASLQNTPVLSYSVWYWHDQHKVVTVTIVSPSGDSFGVYHARKGDISEAKMVTVEGVHIRFSNAERLEILED